MIESPHLHPLYYISCIVPCSLRPIVFCKQNASCRRLPLVNCKSLLPPQKSQRFLFTSQSSAVRPEIWLQLFYIAKVFLFWGLLFFWAKLYFPKYISDALYSSILISIHLYSSGHRSLWYSALLNTMYSFMLCIHQGSVVIISILAQKCGGKSFDVQRR